MDLGRHTNTILSNTDIFLKVTSGGAVQKQYITLVLRFLQLNVRFLILILY